jgi:hypothetical protein
MPYIVVAEHRQYKAEDRMKSLMWCAAALSLMLLACNLATPAPTPLPTPDLPTVEIIDPPNNRQIVEGTAFAFDIVGRDAGPGISKLELYIDGALINAISPFENLTEPIFRAQINWVAQGTGLRVVEAIAFRQDGQRSDPAIITIEVLPAAP